MRADGGIAGRRTLVRDCESPSHGLAGDRPCQPPLGKGAKDHCPDLSRCIYSGKTSVLSVGADALGGPAVPGRFTHSPGRFCLPP